MRVGQWSLRFKLATAISVVFLIGAGAFLLWFPAQMRALGVVAAEYQARSVAMLSADHVASSVQERDQAALDGEIFRLKAVPNVVSVGIYGKGGETLSGWKEDVIPADLRLTSGVTEIRVDESELLIAQPIRSSNGAEGLVVIGFSLAPVERARSQAFGSAVVIGVTIAVLGALIGLFVGGFLVGPLRDVIAIARRIAAGTESLEGLQTGGDENGDEAQQLRHAVGLMARRLQAQLADLEAERTRAEHAEHDATGGSRAKSAFLASMSHELRTPMNAIIGYSEMLQEDLENTVDETSLQDLGRIHRAALHLLSLINDILDISKIEAGKMDVYPEPFSIPILIEDIVSAWEPDVARSGNTLSVELDEDLGTMYSDVSKVRQVIGNLLSNAAKFTEDGEVFLTGRFDAGFVEFEVRDTGIGMSPGELDRIFQAFEQGDTTSTRSYGGTGLGLTLVNRIVDMLDGTFEVTSELGVGSCFVVRFPLSQGERTVTPSHGTPERGQGTVLVIDDDKSIQQWLHRALSREGFGVVIADSGEAGIAAARDVQPVLITLDLEMPGMDGWDVLSMLKSDPVTSEIPVVIVSVQDIQGQGFSVNAVDYLTKPVDRRRLLTLAHKYGTALDEGHILLVEDDEATAEMVRRVLTRDGYNVERVSNGQEALAVTSRPALVMLDLMMPELDGFGFLEAIRDEPRWAGVPVVVMTAMSLTPAQKSRLLQQVQGVVSKGGANSEDLLKNVVSTARRMVPTES